MEAWLREKQNGGRSKWGFLSCCWDLCTVSAAEKKARAKKARARARARAEQRNEKLKAKTQKCETLLEQIMRANLGLIL